MAGRDLYILQMAVTGDVKVGRSDDVERRMRDLQTGCPHKLKIILHGPNLGHREREMHTRLRRYRTRVMKGEWFTEDCLGELPIPIYELIFLEVLEDPDWWKRRR